MRKNQVHRGASVLTKQNPIRPRCAFVLPGTSSEQPCGDPAIAVYVSDDAARETRPVCWRHREAAIEDGDGPIYELTLAKRMYHWHWRQAGQVALWWLVCLVTLRCQVCSARHWEAREFTKYHCGYGVRHNFVYCPVWWALRRYPDA